MIIIEMEGFPHRPEVVHLNTGLFYAKSRLNVTKFGGFCFLRAVRLIFVLLFSPRKLAVECWSQSPIKEEKEGKFKWVKHV